MLPPLDRGKPCIYQLTSKDDELLRYALDGVPLSRSIEEHIVKCGQCCQRLESFISIHHALLRTLYRCRCPDINILARYSAGLASLDEGLFVLYHLHSCPLCTQELQEMRSVLESEVS